MTAIHRLVASCQAGENPRAVGKMRSGWVILGESQFLTGYCLLLPDPVVPHLNAMEPADQLEFLSDMCKVGDVLMQLTDAVRVNYAMFGNQEPALHAHLVPRYDSEPEPLRTATPWSYNWAEAPQFSVEAHGVLLLSIRRELDLLG